MYSWQVEFGDAFADQRVLVTGATGFIGWHLCEALVALGAEVHGLSRTAFVHRISSVAAKHGLLISRTLKLCKQGYWRYSRNSFTILPAW